MILSLKDTSTETKRDNQPDTHFFPVLLLTAIQANAKNTNPSYFWDPVLEELNIKPFQKWKRLGIYVDRLEAHSQSNFLLVYHLFAEGGNL